ncbi:MAG TPA: hypothetical protein VFW98_10360 [Gemmatimonadaceae bacterium]|nr:hypothetical protein [Gemmatimonadaceae bacterium]
MNETLETLVTTTLGPLGFDLVELRAGGSRSRPSLQVRMERQSGEPVTVDDCARASRALDARLREEGEAAEQYTLEVSSPGVERPLRSAAEWRRFTGQRAVVLSPVLGGREEVEIVEVEGSPGAEVIHVRTPRGDEPRIPLAEIREARLAFHW